jgi:hypothetical protein
MPLLNQRRDISEQLCFTGLAWGFKCFVIENMDLDRITQSQQRIKLKGEIGSNFEE